MMKGMLSLVDKKGQVALNALVSCFRSFYEERADAGLQVEVSSMVMNRVKEIDTFEIARVMLTMPFEKIERKFFLEHRKDLNCVAFVPSLWRRLTLEDCEDLIKTCDEQIEWYYKTRCNS